MRRLSPLAVVPFLLLPAAAAFAGDKTWVGTTTDWSTGSNWNPAGVPGNADRAIIPTAPTGGRFPTIVATPSTINQLLVSAAATLTINTGVDLNIDGGTSPFIDGTGTVVTAGTGRVQITGGSNNFTVINDSMTLGNLTLNPGFNRTFIVTSGKTVVLNGNLTLLSGGLRIGLAGGAANALTIKGNLSIPTSTTLEVQSSNSTIWITGNWVQTGRWQAGPNATVIFNGTTAQNIDIDRRQVASFDFENMRISNTSAPVTYLNNNPANTPNGMNINHNLTVDAGENTGAPTFGPGAFPAHVKGLPRGWKLLENLANTAALGQRPCMLYVGAMNHIGGVAGWARIFASCAR